jgi:hypothetical protein
MTEPDALLRVGQRRAALVPARDVKLLAVPIGCGQAREYSRLILRRQPIEPLAQREAGSCREFLSLGHPAQAYLIPFVYT